MGFCMALSVNSVGIPGGFQGNAGFSGKFEVWGGFGGCSLDPQDRNEGTKNRTTVPKTGTRAENTELSTTTARKQNRALGSPCLR